FLLAFFAAGFLAAFAAGFFLPWATFGLAGLATESSSRAARNSSPTLTFFFFELRVSTVFMSPGRRTDIWRCSSRVDSKRSKLKFANAKRTTSLVDANPSLAWADVIFSIKETGRSKVSGEAGLGDFLAMAGG